MISVGVEISTASKVEPTESLWSLDLELSLASADSIGSSCVMFQLFFLLITALPVQLRHSLIGDYLKNR